MSTLTHRVPEPDTAILGETEVRVVDKQWNLVTKVYNAVLYATAIGAIAVILMVKAGIVDAGDKDDQDDWVEVASQVITGVFTWISITQLPVFVCGIIMTSRVLKLSEDWKSRTRAARYLNKKFPLVFINPKANHLNNFDYPEAGCTGEDFLDSQPKQLVEDFVFFRDDAKYLRFTLIMLSGGCLFQFIMAGYMWAYDSSSRPDFVLPALLSPVILCNIGGQYRLAQLSKRNKKRRTLTVDDAPIFGELSSTQNSPSSF